MHEENRKETNVKDDGNVEERNCQQNTDILYFLFMLTLYFRLSLRGAIVVLSLDATPRTSAASRRYTTCLHFAGVTHDLNT